LSGQNAVQRILQHELPPLKFPAPPKAVAEHEAESVA
jgi:hypothetical protein